MNLFGFFSISLLFLAYSTASKNGKDIESRMELLENMLSSQIQSQIDLQKELTKAKQELSSIQMTTSKFQTDSTGLHPVINLGAKFLLRYYFIFI